MLGRYLPTVVYCNIIVNSLGSTKKNSASTAHNSNGIVHDDKVLKKRVQSTFGNCSAHILWIVRLLHFIVQKHLAKKGLIQLNSAMIKGTRNLLDFHVG